MTEKKITEKDKDLKHVLYILNSLGKVFSKATLESDSKKNEEQKKLVQDNLDYLRLYSKYQVFNIEASNRENNFLRNMFRNKKEDESDFI